MAFMSMQGHFWSYNEFSWVLAKCLHNFQKNCLPLFELIKDKATSKVQYSILAFSIPSQLKKNKILML
jgi:hypothetical protein